MRIAFTHNLQTSESEEQAEFDRPETVRMIVDALEAGGHEVEPVEVSGPASRTVARLEAIAPDLVFNTAEGRHGRYREAFFPGLFDQLGLPYTGSDAYTCLLTLDKQLTKRELERHGVPSPRGWLVERIGQLDEAEIRTPVIVKPNFEGSSMGITQDSVVDDPTELRPRVAELLSRYPSGVLVEEYVEGTDVVVPFLESASPATGGVLAAASFAYPTGPEVGRRWPIYDYTLKQVDFEAVRVEAPAPLAAAVSAEIAELSARVFRALSIRDAGRIDFRVTADGRPYFIEINALPSLEAGASIHVCAALAGLGDPSAVLDAIVRSAARRFGLELSRRRRRRRARVGLAFNLKRVKPAADGEVVEDSEAEYDAPSTIASIREAIESHGHEVVELEATPELATTLASAGVDVVFNVAEGIRGRSREGQVPSLLELLGIPYTGSDPATLALALDKGLAKRVVAQAGVPTPPFVLMQSGKEKLPRDFPFPAIVKPVAEGSSKGVRERSVVTCAEEAREAAAAMAARYGQPAMVEGFLTGREFTVALVGERRPRVLPPMEIVFQQPGVEFPVYTFETKLDAGEAVRYEVPAKVDAALGRELERVARQAFAALGCRDLGRVDLRCDGDGRVCFIELNPLPGLTPGWSDLCIIAEAAGIAYRDLIGEILSFALRRMREGARAARRAAA